MKYKSNLKNCKIILLIIILLLISKHKKIIADNNKLIYIYSNQQIIDMNKDVITFDNQVIIKYDNINICANKVIINNLHSKQNKEIIKIYGTPVNFFKLKNNKKFFSGHALQIHCEMFNHSVILIGKVYLEYLNNIIQGDYIKYFFDQKQIEVLSCPGNTVKIILTPVKTE